MGTCCLCGSKTYVVAEALTEERERRDIKLIWKEKKKEADFVADILILGTESAGKTTLAQALTGFTAKNGGATTRSFQVFQCHDSPTNLPLRVWDTGSSVGVRMMWPIFCQTLDLSSVLFVVTPRICSSEQALNEIQQWLRYLVSEECLRLSTICFVVNNQGGQVSPEALETLRSLTYEQDIAEALQSNRFASIICDVKDIWSDDSTFDAISWAVWGRPPEEDEQSN